MGMCKVVQAQMEAHTKALVAGNMALAQALGKKIVEHGKSCALCNEGKRTTVEFRQMRKATSGRKPQAEVERDRLREFHDERYEAGANRPAYAGMQTEEDEATYRWDTRDAVQVGGFVKRHETLLGFKPLPQGGATEEGRAEAFTLKSLRNAYAHIFQAYFSLKLGKPAGIAAGRCINAIGR